MGNDEACWPFQGGGVACAVERYVASRSCGVATGKVNRRSCRSLDFGRDFRSFRGPTASHLLSPSVYFLPALLLLVSGRHNLRPPTGGLSGAHWVHPLAFGTCPHPTDRAVFGPAAPYIQRAYRCPPSNIGSRRRPSRCISPSSPPHPYSLRLHTRCTDPSHASRTRRIIHWAWLKPLP